MVKMEVNGSFFFIRLVCLVLLLVMSSLEMIKGAVNATGGGDAAGSVVLVKVGVVADMEKLVTKVAMSCIEMALSDFYAARPHHKTKLVLETRDSMGDVVTAAAAVLDLIENVKVEAIIGPTTSSQAEFVINLGEKAQVPIVTYSATSPVLESIGSHYFIQATQDDSYQVQAITALIQAFGWREVVPIYIGNEFGSGPIPHLEDALQQIGDRVPYCSVIPSFASDEDIVAELYKLMTMQTRVFVVHMTSTLGARLFLKVAELGMMSQGYVWIVTNALANTLNTLPTNVIQSMEGVLGLRTYVPSSNELKSFSRRWKRDFMRDNPSVLDPQLNVFGLWAYDAVSALATAVEQVGATSFMFQEGNNTFNSSTVLYKIRVSQAGPRLLSMILDTRFKGLSGNFSLLDGQLEPSSIQLINVIGGGTKEIGFWTEDKGLIRHLNSGNTNASYATSRANLGAIIWPGDDTSIPKGWVVPTNGKKLLVGVPITGFTDFVKVTTDSITNSTMVTGFCIDIFEEVIKALPYSVPFKYVPFQKPDGEIAGTYDDMLYQIYLQNFDAVVGDVTIVANRSLYVDFTLPYTESGVTMVVPVKGDNKHKAWIFLRPLSWDLWIASLFFFAFIAFVIWVLEHRINREFRGPRHHQVGASLYYSFSVMVFAHGQVIFNNWTRVVIVIWIFVVLILTQCYTASLSSMLTVQQLQPKVKDVEELIRGKENVGCKKRSFIYSLLQQMHFDSSRLITYHSIEELDELFKNGRIAAAFDEIPYLKLLLGSSCSRYTTVPPIYKTGGFGFAFPIGSPLVSDVSRAILNVTEGDKMAQIENKWFNKQDNCPDSSAVSSTSLGLDSFWGLFMITGLVSTLALASFVAEFFYEHRNIWFETSPGMAIWSRIKQLLIIFDQPNLQYHTFRRHDMNAASAAVSTPSAPQTPSNNFGNNSPHHFCSPSPSCHGEPSTLAREHVDSNNTNMNTDTLGNQEQGCEVPRPVLHQGQVTQ